MDLVCFTKMSPSYLDGYAMQKVGLWDRTTPNHKDKPVGQGRA